MQDDWRRNTMLSLRLVGLIEEHSEEITQELNRKIKSSPRTSDVRKIPEPELQMGITEMLQHLREWLLTKTDADIQTRYRRLGARRARQGVALADCCWILTLTRDCLWDFLQERAFVRNVIEIYGKMELLVLLDGFFGHALCYVVEGYERSNRPVGKDPPQMGEPDHPEVNMAAWVT
jgi:hypothetical protein